MDGRETLLIGGVPQGETERNQKANDFHKISNSASNHTFPKKKNLYLKSTTGKHNNTITQPDNEALKRNAAK